MANRINCPGCGAALSLPEGATGQELPCPHCKASIPVPPAATMAIQDDRRAVGPPSPSRDLPAYRPTQEGRRGPEPPRSSAGAILYLVGGILLGMVALTCCGGFALLFLVIRLNVAPVAPQDRTMVFKPPPDRFVEDPADAPLRDWPLRPDGPPKPLPPPLKMPPLPDTVPIQPAPLKEDTAYALPDVIRRIAVGGGGRFLVLHFPNLSKLGIFDVNEAKLTHYIDVADLADGDIRFAAGMTRLVIYSQAGSRVESWDLLTRKRTHDGKIDIRGGLRSFCIGPASDGPVLVYTDAGRLAVLDIDTWSMKVLPLVKNEAQMPFLGQATFWPSADGRVFGLSDGGKVNCLVFEGGHGSIYSDRWNASYVQPGPDGKYLFTGGSGVLTNRVTPTDDAVLTGKDNAIASEGYFLPAHHGPFYLHLHMDSVQLAGFGSRLHRDQPAYGISIYLMGEKQPIHVMRGVKIPRYDDLWRGAHFGVENMVHLIPRGQVLIVIPATLDKLLLYPVDLDQELENAKVKYLLVTSQPPGKAVREPTYVLDSGPPGMSVSPDGLLQWTPPANYAKDEAAVIVKVGNGEGQERFHAFTLTIQ